RCLRRRPFFTERRRILQQPHWQRQPVQQHMLCHRNEPQVKHLPPDCIHQPIPQRLTHPCTHMRPAVVLTANSEPTTAIKVVRLVDRPYQDYALHRRCLAVQVEHMAVCYVPLVCP
ncbi:hypothetical protein FBU59_005369, partial [Linderina macrospora]